MNSKWIKDLNMRLDTIKLSEENIGKTLFDINHSKLFYDPPPRVMKIKTKISECDLIKLKNLCTAMETTNKTKDRASLVAQWLRILLPMQGHGFKPWSGKSPNAMEQLSWSTTTTEPAL